MRFVSACCELLGDLVWDLAAGTSDQYKAEGLQVRKAQEIVGIKEHGRPGFDKLPDRYQILAVRAFLAEELSEGQLLSYLETSRLAAREIVQHFQEQMTLNDDGLPDMTELALEQPVLVRSR